MIIRMLRPVILRPPMVTERCGLLLWENYQVDGMLARYLIRNGDAEEIKKLKNGEQLSEPMDYKGRKVNK